MKLSERLELKRDAWRGTKFWDDICELLDEAAEPACAVGLRRGGVSGESYARIGS